MQNGRGSDRNGIDSNLPLDSSRMRSSSSGPNSTSSMPSAASVSDFCALPSPPSSPDLNDLYFLIKEDTHPLANNHNLGMTMHDEVERTKVRSSKPTKSKGSKSKSVSSSTISSSSSLTSASQYSSHTTSASSYMSATAAAYTSVPLQDTFNAHPVQTNSTFSISSLLSHSTSSPRRDGQPSSSLSASSDGSSKRQRWTNAEMELVEAHVKKFGQDWPKVQEEHCRLGFSRSVMQIKRKWGKSQAQVTI